MRLRISAAAAHGCGGESFYDFAHLAAAAQEGKRVATPLQNRHWKCCTFFAEKSSFPTESIAFAYTQRL